MGKSNGSGRQALIEGVESRRLLSTVIYVDTNATDSVQDGASWATAYLDLQQALAAATSGDEIRVAKGTYKPTNGTDRSTRFALKTGVEVRGGYAGTGSPVPDARNVGLNQTILSGEIGRLVDTSDNSKAIVGAISCDATAVLDGFILTQAAGIGGGALLISNASPTIRNCTFLHNLTSGVRCNAASSPEFFDCVFRENQSLMDGAGMYNMKSSPSLIDCTFISNSTPKTGGAIYNSTATPFITGCTFVQNDASSGGAISNDLGSVSTISHCSFTENSAVLGGAVYDRVNAGTSAISYSTFLRNFAGTPDPNSGNGGGYYGRSGVMVNCRFYANTAGYGGGASGGTLKGCVLVGNAAFEGGATAYASLVNCTVVANRAEYYGGGIVWGEVANSIVWLNDAREYPQIAYPSTGKVVFTNIEDGVGVTVGEGNIKADPMFVREPDPGSDEVWGTVDDDYGDLHVRLGSPVVDAASNQWLTDGPTKELDEKERFQDLPTVPDTGIGPGPVADMGAFELQSGLAADIGGPYRIAAGHQTQLRAFGVSDFPGQLRYEWEWSGDGQFDDASGPTPLLSAANLSAGAQLSVALRITDSGGNSVITYDTISVVPPVLYVDAAARGTNDGSSWANARTDLASALEEVGLGQTVRVAGGIYKPTLGVNRRASFRLSREIVVQGGFAGATGLDPQRRDIAKYPSILSGDIGTSNSSSDNSYHVVTAANVDASTVFDGFDVTGGNGDVRPDYFNDATRGGGMRIDGDLTISNCTFTGNSVIGMGGGVSVNSGSPRIVNCVFLRNSADAGGGISINGNAVVINCQFLGNSSRAGGGAFTGAYAQDFVGCSFVGNQAEYGGGIYANTGQLINCTFVANTKIGIFFSGAYVRAVNCIVWSADAGVAGWEKAFDIQASLVNIDPRFVREPNAGLDRKWGTVDDDFGDLRTRIGSPCFDGGDNSAVPAGVTTDLAGNPRFVDVPGQRDPGAIVDVGAYERVAPFADPSFNPDSAGPSVEVRFGFDVMASSLSASDLVLKNLTTGEVISVGSLASVSYDPATHIASWTFAAALADGNYRATLPAGSVLDTGANPALGADLVFDFYALAGDANRDRKVDLADMSILSANWQGSGKTFSQGDFNYDGNVDAADLAILSSNWQKQLLITDIAAPPARPPVRQPVRVAKLVL